MSALKYLIREPQEISASNPAIVLLHGYGSNAEDLFSFESELPKNSYVIAIQAPHDLQFGSYAWYAINFDAAQNKFSDTVQAIESRDMIVDFLGEICEKYPINKDQITLIGFSQGAILSYSIGLSYPEKISKVVALSGYLMSEIIHEDYLKNNLTQVKFFVSHGKVDQVIPIDWARKTQPFLEKLGIDVTYKEYPVGHGIAPQNFYDFKNWLENN